MVFFIYIWSIFEAINIFFKCIIFSVVYYFILWIANKIIISTLSKDEHKSTTNGNHIHRDAAAAAAKSLQSCPTLCDPHRRQPTRLPHPWDSPGKNTGVGCQFLLQGMKVKSQSEVSQSCPTLSNPMDCSLPGSSIHGIFQARVLEWGAMLAKGMKLLKNMSNMTADFM